jgi:hypothetical protein
MVGSLSLGERVRVRGSFITKRIVPAKRVAKTESAHILPRNEKIV